MITSLIIIISFAFVFAGMLGFTAWAMFKIASIADNHPLTDFPGKRHRR